MAEAKVAYEEAIRAAEGAGHSLYTSTDYMLDGYDNAEPADPVQHRLRYTIIEPANTEVIWQIAVQKVPTAFRTSPFHSVMVLLTMVCLLLLPC